MCEEAREEKTGKFTIIGFFPGSRLVVTSPPTADKKVTVVLTFMVVFCDGEGDAKLHARVLDPDGTEVIAMVVAHPVTKLSDKVMTLAMHVPAFPITKLGTYTMRLNLDDKTFDFPFYVESTDVRTH